MTGFMQPSMSREGLTSVKNGVVIQLVLRNSERERHRNYNGFSSRRVKDGISGCRAREIIWKRCKVIGKRRTK